MSIKLFIFCFQFSSSSIKSQSNLSTLTQRRQKADVHAKVVPRSVFVLVHDYFLELIGEETLND